MEPHFPRRVLIALLVAALGAAAGPAPAAAKEQAIALLPFEAATEGGAARGELLTELVAAGLSARFAVVERQELAKVLAEQKLSLSGLVAADQAVPVGKLVGATFLVAGRVFPLDDHVTATARVIGVETGRFKGLTVALPLDAPPEAVAERLVAELTANLPRLQKELMAPAEEGAAAAKLLGTGPTVAVLNFANQGQGDPAWDWLGKGLADLTISNLLSQEIPVVSREQMQEMLRELELKKAPPEPRGVARVLRASRCVHGTYHVAGGQVELHAAIVDVKTGARLHAAAVSGPAGQLLALHKRLSAELADVLQGNEPGTLDPARLPRWTESLPASQLLYQGIDRFDKGQYLEAWELFRRGLAQDPHYADGLYWAGRMMYYTQEYHHARVDLERFVVEHPKHPRVGDAVMEIIHAVQHTATGPAEVLDILTFAVQLAPRAEVPNQFGPGQSSVVALYAAGLAAQILLAEKRYRDAFDRFAEAAQFLPHDHPLYWAAWHEMFGLRVKHLQLTAELLPMPPKPRLAALLRKAGARPETLAPTGRTVWTEDPPAPPHLHPVGIHSPGGFAGVPILHDDPIWQDFVRLTPEKDSVEFDFSAQPLTVSYPFTPEARARGTSSGKAHTRYLYTDPQHCFTAMEVEIRYRHDPAGTFGLQLWAGGFQAHRLGPAGVWRVTLPVAPNTQMVPANLEILTGPPAPADVSKAGVLSWKLKAKFAPFKPTPAPGAVVLHVPIGLRFDVILGGRAQMVEAGRHRIDDVPSGPNSLVVHPVIVGPSKEAKTDFQLKPGEVVEFALSARLDPRLVQPRPEIPVVRGRVSTDYEAFRMGARMGDTASEAAGGVHVCEDRFGRWVAVWGVNRDLYLAVSTDQGYTWSATWKLPPPVNTAHNEQQPFLTQDADGRYLLAFRSDRNLQRTHAVYVCWSDDLVNFSAPALVDPHPGEAARVLRRADGTYLAYFRFLYFPGIPLSQEERARLPEVNSWVVCTSNDLVHWTPPKTVLPHTLVLELIEYKGRFLALHEGGRAEIRDRPDASQANLYVQASEDGVSFADPTVVPVRAGTINKEGGGIWMHDIRTSQRNGGLEALVGSLGADVFVLRYQDDKNWPVQKQVGHAYVPDFWRSTAVLASDGVCFLGPAKPSPLTAPADRPWHVPAQPLLLVRQPYDPPRPAQPHPTFAAPPSMVEVRLLRRYPSGTRLLGENRVAVPSRLTLEESP